MGPLGAWSAGILASGPLHRGSCYVKGVPGRVIWALGWSVNVDSGPACAPYLCQPASPVLRHWEGAGGPGPQSGLGALGVLPG